MRTLILPFCIAITMHAHADDVVFKCIDAKGNFSYSTQLCPEKAKTVAKTTMVSTEAKYGKNSRNYRDELRDSQYQNHYYRYYRYEKPNVFSEIAQKKEAEQQRRWDNTGRSRAYNRSESTSYSPYNNGRY